MVSTLSTVKLGRLGKSLRCDSDRIWYATSENNNSRQDSEGLYRRIVIEAEGESRSYLVSCDQAPRNFGFPDWDSVKLSTPGALFLSQIALRSSK